MGEGNGKELNEFGLVRHEIEKLPYTGFDPMISTKMRKLIGEAIVVVHDVMST